MKKRRADGTTDEPPGQLLFSCSLSRRRPAVLVLVISANRVSITIMVTITIYEHAHDPIRFPARRPLR